jgi:Cfr10I/Bse634I restriction endonuclease
MAKSTKTDKAGKVTVASKATFLTALTKCDPYKLQDFGVFLKNCESLVKAEFPTVHANALNKVRGDWYEWLIALNAIKYASINDAGTVMIKLPNVSSFECSNLFVPKIAKLVADLRIKVKESEDVSLITSNPDFCLIKRNILPSKLPDPRDLAAVDQLFRKAEGKCELDDITGYVAVKTSLKPDRRLQIPHEGSLMKALYRHIQTRNWLIDAPGVKFYAFTQKYTNADAKALKTVATHSITDVSSKPQSAVDQIFSINSSAGIFNALAKISV